MKKLIAALMMVVMMGAAAPARGVRQGRVERDWAAETTDHAGEVVEMALAHAIRNRAEAAYRRGDLLDKRRALMGDWAGYLAGRL